MAEPFVSATVRTIRAAGVVVAPDEAAAICWLLGERLGWRTPRGDAGAIVLDGNGNVYARRDGRTPASVASYVMLLSALASDGIEAPSVRAWAEQMCARLAAGAVSPDATIAEIRSMAGVAPASSVMAVLARWAELDTTSDAPDRHDRRTAGPTTSELRRQLQQSDLDRFELISRLARLESTPRSGEVAAVRVRVELPAEADPAPPPMRSAAAPSAPSRRRRQWRRLGRVAVRQGGVAAGTLILALIATPVADQAASRVDRAPAAPPPPPSAAVDPPEAEPLPARPILAHLVVRAPVVDTAREPGGRRRNAARAARPAAPARSPHASAAKKPPSRPNGFIRFVKRLIQA